MITVSTPAAKTALTTLAAVKATIAIKPADVEWARSQIDFATAAICNYIGVEMAEDGTRNLGRETIVETLDRRARFPWLPPFGVTLPRREADSYLVLGRRPIVSVAGVTENGVTVDSCDYQIEATTGKLRRLSSNLPAAWPCTLVVVTYTAGWLLPEQDKRNLPADIEQAAIECIVAQYAAKGRDQNVKAENIPGVRETQYFFGQANQADGPLPISTMAKLNPYRNISV